MIQEEVIVQMVSNGRREVCLWGDLHERFVVREKCQEGAQGKRKWFTKRSLICQNPSVVWTGP